MSLLVAQLAWLLYFPMWGGMVCPAKSNVTEQVSPEPYTLHLSGEPDADVIDAAHIVLRWECARDYVAWCDIMLCMLCCVPEALLCLLQDYYYSDWTAEEREQGKHMQVRCRMWCCIQRQHHTPAVTMDCSVAFCSTQATQAACHMRPPMLTATLSSLQVMKFCNESKSQRGMKRIQMEAKSAGVGNGAV